MKKINLYILLIVVFTGCQKPKKNIPVEHFGVLREIMMEQKINANFDLKELENTPNVFALGALEGLGGETLMLNGKIFNGIASHGELAIDNSFNHKATLLVKSAITDWQTKTVQFNIEDLKGLEALIKEEAEKVGINSTEAFPFMLKGEIQSMGWHVVNANEATEKSHEAFKAAGMSGEAENETVTILGFYSEKHEGIFTHHGSYLHLHFVNETETQMGHIEALENEGSLELLLPKTKQP